MSLNRWRKAFVKFLALTAEEETPLATGEPEVAPEHEVVAALEQSAKNGTRPSKCYGCGVRPSWPHPGPEVSLTLYEGNRWYCHRCGPQQGKVPLHQLPGDEWPMSLRAKLAFPSRKVQDWVRYRRQVDNVGRSRFNIDLPAYECGLCGGWHKALPSETPPCY